MFLPIFITSKISISSHARRKNNGTPTAIITIFFPALLLNRQFVQEQRTFSSLQIAHLNIQCHMTFTLVSPLHCESFSSRACSCADIYHRTANSFKPPAAVPRERRRLGLVLQNFANFWRARSRLYQNEILQENMRLTAFFKLYRICVLLRRCNLKILAKIGLKNQ